MEDRKQEVSEEVKCTPKTNREHINENANSYIDAVVQDNVGNSPQTTFDQQANKMTRTNIPSFIQTIFYGTHYAVRAPDNYSESSNFALGAKEEISEVNHLKAAAARELQVKKEDVRYENREQFNVNPIEFDPNKIDGANLFDLNGDLTQCRVRVERLEGNAHEYDRLNNTGSDLSFETKEPKKDGKAWDPNQKALQYKHDAPATQRCDKNSLGGKMGN